MPEAALAAPEPDLAVLTRTLRMVNASNQALIRATDEQALLEEICRIAVEVGSYTLAWVGYAQDDAAKSVRPVAMDGKSRSYVESVKASWAADGRGRGPTGRAIREGQTVIARDFETDAAMKPWRAGAAKYGFRSSISLPLRTNSHVFGALMIYSASPDAFDSAELQLLEELAGDLAFGVTGLRMRVARAAADAQVRQEVERYHRLVDSLNEGLAEIDGDYRIIFANERLAQMLGLEAAGLIGRRTLELIDEESRQTVLEHTRRPGATASDRYELNWVRADGAVVPSLISCRRQFDADHVFLGAVFLATDLTELKRAQAGREQYLRFFRLATDAMAIADPFGRFMEVNPAFEAMTGYSQAELLAKPFLDFVHPEDRDRTAREMELQVSERPSMAFENRYVRKDGSVIDLSWTAYFDETQKVTYATARDITQRKAAERALRDSEARLRLQVERMPFGCVVWDPGFRVLDWNPAAERIFGFPAGEALGKHPYEFLVPGSAKAAIDVIWSRVLSGDETAHSRNENLTRDGRTIVCDWTNTPLKGPKGEVYGVLSMVEDVTQRLQDEQTIRENEGRFRALTGQGLAGVYILDRAGRIDFINPPFAQSLGYEPAEVIGRPFLDYIGGSDREDVARVFGEQIAGGEGRIQIAAGLRRKDGSLMDILAQGTFAVVQGQPVVIGVILDITELKTAERSLLRVNRILQTLSAGNEALVRAKSEDELLQGMCGILVERGGYRLAWIGVAQDDPQRTVAPVASAGDHKAYLESAKISWSTTDPRGGGVTARAIRTGEPQTNQNFAANARMEPWLAEAVRHGFASSAALPLRDNGETFGVLSIYSGDADAFSAEELKLLDELAGDLAFGLKAMRTRAEREAAIQRWRTGLESTISAIAGTMEMRDPYTAGHQHRVARLAVAIARELQLPDDQVQGLYLAGIIHDIGKITIPAELLTKPTKLTSLEYQLIQTHAQSGYDVVKNVDFPWPIAQIILQHHERLDGSGYPRGLNSEQIIPEAKILAVADVVEAMMSHRPYRPALGLDAALAEIEKGAGRTYDEAAAGACVRLFREQGFSLS